MDSGGWLVIVLVLAIIVVALRSVARHRRKRRLIALYGEDIADRIIAKRVWQGMTAEQLRESWGRPADMDQTVYKTKTKTTWKYNQTGKNRFGDRIFLEDDVVVGWKD